MTFVQKNTFQFVPVDLCIMFAFLTLQVRDIKLQRYVFIHAVNLINRLKFESDHSDSVALANKLLIFWDEVT